MSDFHTLPVDEGVAWIRAWTDHTWPMTLQDAFGIRDALGWTPLPDDPEFFITPLSTNRQWAGFITQNDQAEIDSLHFNLSSRHPKNNDQRIIQISHTAHTQYVGALESIWGAGLSEKTGSTSIQVQWTLPSGVSVHIIRSNPLITVDIDSPRQTQITKEYDQAMEDYD